jgi:hypothetical protein
VVKMSESIQNENYFEVQYDIFEVDRGWYNISIMENYVFVRSDRAA